MSDPEELKEFLSNIDFTFHDWKMKRYAGEDHDFSIRLYHDEEDPDLDKLSLEVNYSPFNTEKTTFAQNVARFYTNALRRETVNLYAMVLSMRKMVMVITVEEFAAFQRWYDDFVIYCKAIIGGLKDIFELPVDYYQLFGKLDALTRYYKEYQKADKTEITWKKYKIFMENFDDLGMILFDRCEVYETELIKAINTMGPTAAMDRERKFGQSLLDNNNAVKIIPTLKAWCVKKEADKWITYVFVEGVPKYKRKDRVMELRELEHTFKKNHEGRVSRFVRRFWKDVYANPPNDLSATRFYSVQCKSYAHKTKPTQKVPDQKVIGPDGKEIIIHQPQKKESKRNIEKILSRTYDDPNAKAPPKTDNSKLKKIVSNSQGPPSGVAPTSHLAKGNRPKINAPGVVPKPSSALTSIRSGAGAGAGAALSPKQSGANGALTPKQSGAGAALTPKQSGDGATLTSKQSGVALTSKQSGAGAALTSKQSTLASKPSTDGVKATSPATVPIPVAPDPLASVSSPQENGKRNLMKSDTTTADHEEAGQFTKSETANTFSADDIDALPDDFY